MIEVKNLHKHFGKLEVLNGINEHISPGEKVVVIGPSGSGKSTFLRCLNLLEVPTEGEIYIDGECITKKGTDVNKMREKMGMVFQQFNLFPHLTILDNITLAPIKVKKMVSRTRKSSQWSFSTGSGLWTRRAHTPRSFRADSSSVSQLRARWR